MIQIVVDWGDGRVRMFVNGEKVLSTYYSGAIRVNHIVLGGVPDYDTFEEFELEAPETTNIRIYTSEKDYDYQVYYSGNGGSGSGANYIYSEDRYPNLMPGVPVDGVISFEDQVSGEVASFWANGQSRLSVSTTGATATITNGQYTFSSEFSGSGGTEIRWYLNEKTGNTWIGLYVGGELAVDNSENPIMGTVFGPQYAIKTNNDFTLWQKFKYADDIAIEEPTYVEGYKLYMSQSRDEVLCWDVSIQR